MFNRHHLVRVGRIALAASGIALTLGGAAMAQSVQVFDEAPPLDLLRKIMIPESRPGLSRTIVMQRPDAIAQNSGVQRTSISINQSAPMPSAIAHAAADAGAGAPQADAPDADASTADAPDAAAPQAAEPMPMPQRPAHRAAPAVKQGTVGLRINFAFNSAELPSSSFGMIDRVVEIMKEAPDIKVRVEGHTDAAGAPGYNLSLSERRALSVAQYLVKQGIDPSRLMLIGKGMAEPLTDNPYDPANRRVQFVRVG